MNELDRDATKSENLPLFQNLVCSFPSTGPFQLSFSLLTTSIGLSCERVGQGCHKARNTFMSESESD